MHFCLIDRILEQADDRIVTQKSVSAAEEYLQDHFPSFPVLPGVLMVEAMVQAARRLLADRVGAADPRRFVLGSVKALKYGAMVRPGEAIEVEVVLRRQAEDGTAECRGTARVVRDGVVSETAASGRFTMRRMRETTPRGTDAA